ncbi:P-loop ATPase, Sll1717 family [Brevibacillus brevis]|uniref:ATP-binding protein n=1 Tax=Brevibacillus brevis TaxID=1393 RepID=A0ABY9T4S4_BREBE|nr:hypothetical protein [Brevibacillus brevis]WNC14884.1 hypothetical protein RGB73_00335 [Brevibacillus brevis]
MFTLPLPVKQLYFGRVDASTEINEDKEKFLKNFYDANNVVGEITSNPIKFLILGKKGTGKTSVSKFIELSISEKYTAKYINFEEFDYIQFSEFKSDNRDEYEQYSTPWKWILYSYLSEILLSEDNQQIDLRTIFQKLFGRKGVSLSKLLNKRFNEGIEIPFDFVEEILGYKNEVYLLQDIVEILDVLISEYKLQSSKQYFLIIDGLDEKIKKEKYYTDAILSFLWSISRLNQDFINKKLPIKIIASLRNDVFDLIGGSNVYKKYYDNAVEIKWTNTSSDKFSYPLAGLISTRIKTSLLEKGFQEIEGDLVKRLLTTHVYGKEWKTRTWNFILDMTTYKPRDVISFLQECHEICNEDVKQIPQSVVWQALNNYSKYLVKEFKSELHGHITKEQADEIFDVIFPSLGKTFNYNDFYLKIGKSKHCLELTGGDILRLFYELGIVGFYVNDSHIEWYHREKSIVKKEFSSQSSKYQINQGLYKALSFW